MNPSDLSGKNTLLFLGIACVITAVVGGGVTTFGVEFPVIKTLARQLSLGFLGLLLMVPSLISYFKDLNVNFRNLNVKLDNVSQKLEKPLFMFIIGDEEDIASLFNIFRVIKAEGYPCTFFNCNPKWRTRSTEVFKGSGVKHKSVEELSILPEMDKELEERGYGSSLAISTKDYKKYKKDSEVSKSVEAEKNKAYLIYGRFKLHQQISSYIDSIEKKRGIIVDNYSICGKSL